MSESVVDNPGSIYENPGYALDISFRAEWGEVRAEALDIREAVAGLGTNVHDIRITYEFKNWGTETISVYKELESRLSFDDLEFYKDLIRVLGNQSAVWVGHEKLYELLQGLDPDYPPPKTSDPKWSPEVEKDWVNDLIQLAINRDYDFVWDFEGNKGWGPEMDDEWERMTDPYRH